MDQRNEKRIQDPIPRVIQHLDAIRKTTEYKLFLQAVVGACRVSGSQPEENLARVADAVLRPMARDLSACCPGSKVVIFHMLAMNDAKA